MLPWLWCRTAASAPIRSLAWKLPYATGVALGEKKKKKAFQQMVLDLNIPNKTKQNKLKLDTDLILLQKLTQNTGGGTLGFGGDLGPINRE